VCVLAYRDLDADGQQDEGERFLAGVTLRLTHLRSNVFDSWTTDGANDPDHCWSALIEGEYSLRAVSFPSGLGPSGLAEHRFTVPFPGAPARYAFGARPPATATLTASPSPSLAATVRPTVTPTPEDTAQPTVTGPSGEVCVRIFEDRDGDGQPAGEPWIGGQLIQILDEGRALSRALRSLAAGGACARLPVGVYFVRTDRPAGAEATTAEEAPVLLSEGSRKDIVFGWRYDRPTGARIWLPVTAKMSRWAAPAARQHGPPGAGRLGWAPRRSYD
jgi:hypothetical protein